MSPLRPRPPARSLGSGPARPISVLLIGPILSAIVLTTLGFFAIRTLAWQSVESQNLLAAQAMRSEITATDGALDASSGQLVTGIGGAHMTLNGNAVEAQRLQRAFGVSALIAQQEHGNLVVVASSLSVPAGAHSPAGLGERLDAQVMDHLSACEGTDPLRLTYQGAVTLGRDAYLASGVPLVDSTGKCVGAIMAITSQRSALMAPIQYTVIMAMAGALIALLTIMLGLALYGRKRSGRELEATLNQLESALASATVSLQALSEQSGERERTLARAGERQRALAYLFAALTDQRAALQRITSDIWASASQPGAPVDAFTALRLARESAVASAGFVSRLDEFVALVPGTLDELDAAVRMGRYTQASLTEARVAVGNAHAALTSATDLERRPGRRKGKAVARRRGGDLNPRTGEHMSVGVSSDVRGPARSERQGGDSWATGGRPIPSPDGSWRSRSSAQWPRVGPPIADQRSPRTGGHRATPDLLTGSRGAHGHESGIHPSRSANGWQYPDAGRQPQERNQPPENRNPDGSSSRWLND